MLSPALGRWWGTSSLSSGPGEGVFFPLLPSLYHSTLSCLFIYPFKTGSHTSDCRCTSKGELELLTLCLHVPCAGMAGVYLWAWFFFATLGIEGFMYAKPTSYQLDSTQELFLFFFYPHPIPVCSQFLRSYTVPGTLPGDFPTNALHSKS